MEKSQEMGDSVQPAFVTVPKLVDSFRSLGLNEGRTVLVHSSLRSMGWVCGGAVAVLNALEAVIGDTGTLVMPTHSADLSEPEHWVNPPVPKSWWQEIRDTMPAFDAAVTPCPRMGALPELFRQRPGVVRSSHPQTSFAAKGHLAEVITANHGLVDALGDGSPLAKIYDVDGWILLLGVGHERNTSFHLGECRGLGQKLRRVINGAPMAIDGQRRWVKFEDAELSSDDFGELGRRFDSESESLVVTQIGDAEVRLMKQREAVDFARRHLPTLRQL